MNLYHENIIIFEIFHIKKDRLFYLLSVDMHSWFTCAMDAGGFRHDKPLV